MLVCKLENLENTKCVFSDHLILNMLLKTWLQVRKRPLNKKELAKNEEDIITIESRSSFLTVHETKLKVRFGLWLMWFLLSSFLEF